MIFISYRISDTNQFVARIDNDLTKEFGHESVFRDKTRIRGGEQWPEEIEQNANSRPIMLVVIGKAWTSAAFTEGKYKGFPRLHDPDDWVRKEISIALSTGKIVIPVLVDEAAMPDSTWLSNFGLDNLADFQAVRIRTDDYQSDFRQLVTRLKEERPEHPTSESAATTHAESKRVAERRWHYIQNHPIRSIKIFLVLKGAVGFRWFREVLDDTTLTFSRTRPSFKLGQFLVDSPTFNTKESPPHPDHPVCSFWEVYQNDPGYWFKRIEPTSRELSVVAGFDVVAPWSLVGVQEVAKLEDLSLLTEVGISIPSRAYYVGVEEFILRFDGDTFSFPVRLSAQGTLGFLHELAAEQNKALFYQEQSKALQDKEAMPIGTHFTGIRLLDMFSRQLLPSPNDEESEHSIFGGLSGPNGKAISFYPGMPVGFMQTPESHEYTFTITVPPKIDSPPEIKTLLEKLEANPADTESYAMLGALYSYEGRYQEVIRCLETAISRATPNEDVHGLLADTLRQLGRFDEALTHFQKAATLAPGNARARAGIGFCLHELGQDLDALTHFEAAARMEPSSAEYQSHLRTTLASLKRYSEALVPAQRAVELVPDDHRSAMYLGVLLEMAGRKTESTPYLERATKLAPDSADAHELFGQHLASLNQHAEAIANLQRALDIEEGARRFGLLGASLGALGRWPEAEAAFRNGLKCEPQNSQMLTNLGATVANLGRLSEAAGMFEQAVRLDPTNAAAKKYLKKLRKTKLHLWGKRPS